MGSLSSLQLCLALGEDELACSLFRVTYPPRGVRHIRVLNLESFQSVGSGLEGNALGAARLPFHMVLQYLKYFSPVL